MNLHIFNEPPHIQWTSIYSMNLNVFNEPPYFQWTSIHSMKLHIFNEPPYIQWTSIYSMDIKLIANKYFIKNHVNSLDLKTQSICAPLPSYPNILYWVFPVLVTAQSFIALDNYNVWSCKANGKFLQRGRNWIFTKKHYWDDLHVFIV